MKVKCIVSNCIGLTEGGIYEATPNDNYYRLLNDYGFDASVRCSAFDVVDENTLFVSDNTTHPEQPEEYTGGSSSYYKIKVEHPTTLINPYEAECNDVIEALGMNFAEGNIFKALWRRANARKSGVKKKGYTDGKYDAEKILFFAERLLKMEGE